MKKMNLQPVQKYQLQWHIKSQVSGANSELVKRIQANYCGIIMIMQVVVEMQGNELYMCHDMYLYIL